MGRKDGALSEVPERSRLKWFGSVNRSDKHIIPKVLLEVKTCGRTPRCRPCIQWMDQIKRCSEERRRLEEVGRKARMGRWRQL
jgi:hypothetical protein